ncbi:MAG: nucleotide exchange factor GrpE [Opitutae bacterium]|nr:nucleotide exchange factor GrpE [Opitutae bacterium]
MIAEDTEDNNMEKALEEEVAQNAAGAGGGDGKTSAATVEPVTEELLQQYLKDREELYEKVLRATAEFENFRKRSLREKEELRKYAISGLIEDLLPALDNLDLGLKAAETHPEAKPIADGFRMVAGQLVSILKNNGLETVEPQGEEFDPNFHESVGSQPSDEVEDHKILRVVRKGYILNGRVLRAANVIVSTGPAAEGKGGDGSGTGKEEQ